jgi:hypothetical protein
VWIALSVYVLVSIVKKTAGLDCGLFCLSRNWNSPTL